MADKRAYFKLDVGYLTNPKVAAIALDTPTAVLLHIGSIGYCAQHLTDGVVPIRLILRLTGTTQADADVLMASGLWVDLGNGSASVHDYLEHQRSANEAQRAEAHAKKAADARWKPSSDAPSMPDALHSASPVAMPREREREKELVIAPVALEATTDGDDATTTPRKQERTLPADWAPTAAHYAFATEKHVSIEEAVKTFRNHADTNDRRCRNWNGAFHTWLDKSKPSSTARPGSSLWDRPAVGSQP